MKISFSYVFNPKIGCRIVSPGEGGKLSAMAAIDKAVHGAISNAIKVAGFKGERDKTVDIISPSGSGPERVIAMGVGKPADWTKSLPNMSAARSPGQPARFRPPASPCALASRQAWHRRGWDGFPARLGHAAEDLQVHKVQVETAEWEDLATAKILTAAVAQRKPGMPRWRRLRQAFIWQAIS